MQLFIYIYSLKLWCQSSKLWVKQTTAIYKLLYKWIEHLLQLLMINYITGEFSTSFHTNAPNQSFGKDYYIYPTFTFKYVYRYASLYVLKYIIYIVHVWFRIRVYNIVSECILICSYQFMVFFLLLVIFNDKVMTLFWFTIGQTWCSFNLGIPNFVDLHF